MGIFSGLFKSRDKPENRTAGSAYAFYMGGTTAGKTVTERSAMQMTAVYSCVRILAEAVAGLPLHLYKYTDGGGKEKALADIIITKKVKDSEGFTATVDEVLASVRVYREGRHGSQRWANLAAFSEATDLFRFRCIPGLGITTDHIIVTDGERFEVTSVEDVKGRGMYTEVLAKKVVATVGKG